MDRNSEDDAREIVEELFPDYESRKIYLSMFSEAIREANRHGDEKWGVTLHKDRIRLNIGNLVVCTLQDRKIWLALPQEIDEHSISPKEIPGWTSDPLGYKPIPSLNGFYNYAPSYHNNAWPKIREQHFKYIELAANKYKELSLRSRQTHSSGVIKYLKDEYNLLDDIDSIHITPEDPKQGIVIIPPEFKELIGKINQLKKDLGHTEKAHETLVVMFYEILGYDNITDIKYQKGSIDIDIRLKGKTIIVNEVKKDWINASE